MNCFRRMYAVLALLFFCGSAIAQSVENPHQLTLGAVRAGNLSRLKELVEKHEANLNSRNRLGESLLMMSIKSGKTDIANWLIDQGANVQTPSTAKVTPLMAASFNGDLAMVNRLLEKHADVHAIDQLKKTALVYAAGNGHTDVVERLLKTGIDVNARYPNDLTLLMWAAGQGHAKTVSFLLQVGADQSLTDNRGKTAQDVADEAGHLEVKKALFSQR